MDLDKSLSRVAVLGAAGKMGSGITLLLAEEMARLSLKPENEGRTYRLDAVDLDPDALAGLRRYVHDQARKSGEKRIVELRALLADRAELVENGEIIDAWVARVDQMLWTTTELSALAGAELVFEAIVEKVEIKTSVLKKVREAAPEAIVFTNTSSVPIGLLDREAGLGGRVIGFHFYNPPPVQKLVEIIRAETTTDEVNAVAEEIGKRLRKKLIPSADVAGFIGNGHFIRDGRFGLDEASRLAREQGWPRALYTINRVTQDWLLRPMGIFQLIDYVGIDVFDFIETVMDAHLDEDFGHPVVKRALELGVKGGQRSNGSQKDGFFRYEKGKIAAVYDLEKKAYVELDPKGWTKQADEALGALPENFRPWKALTRAPDRDEQLAAHFKALGRADTLGASLAEAYLDNSRAIGKKLVDTGVAAKAEDVNGVLTLGFFHLYGPINDYMVR